MRHRMAMIAMVAGLGACSSITAPDGAGIAIAITDTSFARQAGGHVVIPFVVTNRDATTAYLSRCGDAVSAVIDREEDDAWVQYSHAPCLTVLDMSLLPLAPGDSIAGSRIIAEPGRYRLRIGAAGSPADYPTWTIVSAAFVVQ